MRRCASAELLGSAYQTANKAFGPQSALTQDIRKNLDVARRNQGRI